LLVNKETGEVRSHVVADVTGQTLRGVIESHVDTELSVLHTDQAHWYTLIGREFADHRTVEHGAWE
jgi:hypothetical protein